MRDFAEFCKVFADAVWACRGVLIAMLLLVLGSSFLIYLFEDMTFWDAFYMALITSLTIGYGDLTPLTAIGKIICIGVGFIGLVFVGLAVAIATLSLRHVISTRHQHDRFK